MGQRGCVVDAVADHANDVAFALEAGDFCGLVTGEDLGEYAVDACGAGDGFGGSAVVAGEHDDFEPESTKGGDTRGGVVFEGVGYRDDTGGCAVDGDEHRCLAVGREPGSGVGQCRRVDAGVGEQAFVADQDPTPGDCRGDAFAGDRVELVGLGDHDVAFVGGCDDRLGERVFGACLG